MSYTLADICEWLRRNDAPAVLLRANGEGLGTDCDVLPQIALVGMSLDSRRMAPGTLFAGVPGEQVHGARFLGDALDRGAAAALVEGEFVPVPGHEQIVLRVDDARSALAALCRGYLGRFAPTVIGITGSNGKTTTKDLTRAALRESVRVGANFGNLNSRWGLPQAVLAQSGEEEVLVLEMGASAPGEIAELCAMSRPRVGCITNIAPAHLEGFGDERGVLETKAALVESLPADGLCVLNADDPNFEELSSRASCERRRSFGRGERSDVRIESSRQTPAGLELRIDGVGATLPVFGEANALNAAAACAIAAEWGVDTKTALRRMAGVPLSPHRSSLREVAGRIVLDDAYNANPRSVEAALHSLANLSVAGQRWAVLGSMRELGERSDELHDAVLRRAIELSIDRIIAVGQEMCDAARRANLECGGANPDPAQLARQLAEAIQPGDAVLFKGSRSVGLERVLDRLVAELHAGESA